MAACDIRAIEVLDACGRAGVSVPDSVAVLGVDNDELLCAHASPPLSSILPGHVEMGRIAAETLDKMAGQNSSPRRHRVLTVPPSKVAERESTHLRSPSAILVDHARRFIQEYATDGIGVQDVASHLRVSRRLAEIRWRDATGGTIRAAIEDVRMAKLTKLLGSTLQPISAIATECGYRDADALARAFRKRFGMSMREWRAKRHDSRSL
jgi:LacI family transcriptional regulator